MSSLVSGTSTPSEPQWLGVYNGIVVNTNDPLRQGRVQLQVPQVLGNAISNWASSTQAGIIAPAVGTQVFVTFLGGNPNLPYFNEGLTANVIESITSNANNVINANAFFVGGSLTGWTAINGMLSATQPNPNTSPPFDFGAELTISGTLGGTISEEDDPFIATPGNNYQISAWVYYPAGGNVNIGAAFNDVSDVSQISPQTVPAATWTPIDFTVTAPPACTQGWPLVGPTTSLDGDLFIAEAITVVGQIDGANIISGSIQTGALGFTATDIGAVGVSLTTGAQPLNPNVGDFWYDGSNGFLLSQWDGTNWNPVQFGTNAIQAGTITANLIAANTITGDVIAAGALDGFTVNSATINSGTVSATDVLVSGTNGGVFIYTAGGGGDIVLNYPTAGTFTFVAPPGVTSVMVECWGGGGTGANGVAANGGGGGGGSGEYAAEATFAVTPGNSYTVVVGAAGANSTFNSTGVVAHHGSNGSGTSGGAGGTGSSNATHHNGAVGGAGSGGVTTVFQDQTGGGGTFTTAAGVTSLMVECWGPGSGGNGGFNPAGGFAHGGSGGGGGGYSRTNADPVSGSTGYSYNVGNGGAGGSGDNGGNSGGNTSFRSNHCFAQGGQGTSSYGHGGNSANGIGDVVHSGGHGGNDDETNGCGGGGGGSVSATNGGGNNGHDNNGTNGGLRGGQPFGAPVNAFGGNGGDDGHAGANGAMGGGGGGNGAAGGGGGDGGDGMIQITYNLPSGGGGGGGGAGSSPVGTGNSGGAGSGGTGGSGGAGVTDGGKGGAGGTGSTNGVAGSGPGGGGGGGGGNSHTGAAGASGQVRVSYPATGSTTLVSALVGAPGNDPILADAVGSGLNLFDQSASPPSPVANVALLYGNQGYANYESADGNSLNVGAIIMANGATLQTISNTSGININGFNCSVLAQPYLVEGIFWLFQASGGGTSQKINFEGGVVGTGNSCSIGWSLGAHGGLTNTVGSTTYVAGNAYLGFPGGALTGTTHGANQPMTITGYWTFASSGTFQLKGLNTATTWTMDAGSWLRLTPAF